MEITRTCFPYVTSLLILLLGGWTFPLGAQYRPDAPPLPRPEAMWLESEAYAADPDAEAVIVWSYGEVTLGMTANRVRLFYHYQTVVKVYSEAAADTFTQLNIDLQPGEQLITIEGSVYYPSDDGGRPERIKINRRMVEERPKDETGEFRSLRVFVPRPRPGAVLVYGYTLASANFHALRPWTFQQPYPVVYSEFGIFMPETLGYLGILQGNEIGLSQRQQAFTSALQVNPILGRNGDLRINGILSSLSRNYRGKRYYVEGLPAFREVPLMGLRYARPTRLEFYLQKIGRGRKSENVLSSWEDFADAQRNDPMLGEWAPEGEIVAERLGIELGVGKKKLKPAALLTAFRERMTWNGDFSFRAEQDAETLLRAGRGNSAELNLLFAALMEALGETVFPVLLSTPDHGFAVQIAPIPGQFNHLVLLWESSRGPRFVDAADPFSPIGLLSLRVLAEQAYVLRNRRPDWVSLPQPTVRSRRTIARFELSTRGKMSGYIRHRDAGYSAVRARQLLARFDDQTDDFVANYVLGAYPEAEAKRLQIRGTESEAEEVATYVELDIPNMVVEGDALWVINPLLAEGYERNPLGREDRNQPIDFGSPVFEEYLLILTLPRGYEYGVVPEDLRVVLPREAGFFEFKTKIIDQHIQLLSRIHIEQALFPPEDFEGIRSFFDYIVAKHGERLVIRKKNHSD